MELAENIDTINNYLTNNYGSDAVTNQPIFRVVWSEDQFEKRMMDVTDEGIQLLTPQVRTVPKYRQWIHERYVLERLVLVPDYQREELADSKISYEPIWVFTSIFDEYLPPKIDACKIVIDSLYAALGKKSLRKYVDDEAQHPVESRELRIKKLEEELFGNETPTTDALAYGTGVSVPNSFDVHSKGEL